MNSGYFFKAENKTDISNNAIFTYLPIQDKQQYHPIYLILTNHFIEMYFHGQIQEKALKNEHVLICKLPISNDRNTLLELSQELSKLNNSMDFNINIHENIYLKANSNNLLRHNYHNYCFANINNLYSSNNYIHTILLDFMFDLYSTEIFTLHPTYQELLLKLDSNVIMKAIQRKADYYYLRNILKCEDGCKNDDNVGKTKKSDLLPMYFKMYLESENSYSDIIVNDDFLKYINRCGKWFYNIEKEIYLMYIDKINSYSRKTFIKKCTILLIDHYNDYCKDFEIEFKKKIRFISNWYKNRYAIISSLLVLCNNKLTFKK